MKGIALIDKIDETLNSILWSTQEQDICVNIAKCLGEYFTMIVMGVLYFGSLSGPCMVHPYYFMGRSIFIIVLCHIAVNH